LVIFSFQTNGVKITAEGEMTTSQLKYAVGIFSDRQNLQEACQELRQHDFSLKNVAAISAREGAIK
jgi:hypothetical protein